MTPSAANEQMYKDDRKEKEEVKQQKCREYEMMLIRRLNLKKEISSLKRSFTANELNIKDYESNEETKEFAHEVRERVWENRARKNWRSDTSFVNEHLELGYYVLSDRERELAAAAVNSHL
jgi:exonuclease VII large subunit